MKKASISELRYAFTTIERFHDQGEEVQITKWRRVNCAPGPGKESKPAPDA